MRSFSILIFKSSSSFIRDLSSSLLPTICVLLPAVVVLSSLQHHLIPYLFLAVKVFFFLFSFSFLYLLGISPLDFPRFQFPKCFGNSVCLHMCNG